MGEQTNSFLLRNASSRRVWYVCCVLDEFFSGIFNIVDSQRGCVRRLSVTKDRFADSYLQYARVHRMHTS